MNVEDFGVAGASGVARRVARCSFGLSRARGTVDQTSPRITRFQGFQHSLYEVGVQAMCREDALVTSHSIETNHEQFRKDIDPPSLPTRSSTLRRHFDARLRKRRSVRAERIVCS